MIIQKLCTTIIHNSLMIYYEIHFLTIWNTGDSIDKINSRLKICNWRFI